MEEKEQRANSLQLNSPPPPPPPPPPPRCIKQAKIATFFDSITSIGTFNSDFLELFRSTSTQTPGGFRFNSGDSRTPIHRKPAKLQSRTTPKCDGQSRSRSNSQGTDVSELGLWLSNVCPKEAASLAEAGRVADEMKPKNITDATKKHNGSRQDETHSQSSSQYDDCSLPSSLSDDEEFRIDKEQKPERRKQNEIDECLPPPSHVRQKKRKRKVYEPDKRVYVDYRPEDVLCQRGGLSNTHEGNCRFRSLKEELQMEYFATPKL